MKITETIANYDKYAPDLARRTLQAIRTLQAMRAMRAIQSQLRLTKTTATSRSATRYLKQCRKNPQK